MTRGIPGYTIRLLLRSPGRSLALAAGLALGVSLVVSILFFVQSSSRQLTQTAIKPVPIDMVGHATAPQINEPQVIDGLRKQPGITAVEPLQAVDFAAASQPGGTIKTPAGKLLAIAPSFFTSFDLISVTSGTFDPGGVLVTDALASHLALKPGDTLSLDIPALGAPYQAKMTGIVDATRAQALFASTDPSKEGEFQVIPDMVIMDATVFARDLSPRLPAQASSQNGALLVDRLQMIRIDRAALPDSPASAQVYVTALARTLERQFTGQIKITNNLGSALQTAASDALTAKVLFIFLGLPGVVLAIFLVRYAGELYGEAQRREIGLLRARGASAQQVLAIAAAAAAVLGVAGTVAGLGLGALVTLLARGSNALASASAGTFVGMAPWALATGLIMAVASSFMPAWNAVRQNVTDERRRVKRVEKTPFWKRAWLDVGALIAAGVVLFIVNRSGGFKPAGGEAQALSLSFYLFLAPLFLWIGLTLFMQRLLVQAIPLFAKGTAGRGSGFGQVAARGMGWRANRLTSAITVVALTLSFGVSLALFTSTYDAQKSIGAHYQVGSDVRVTTALGVAQPAGLESHLLVPGTKSVTSVTRDTKATIGSEKRTMYGIDAASFGATAYLPDSFLVGDSATGALGKLQAAPDGVLIAQDLSNTFNIQVGDPVLVQLSNAPGGYTSVQLKAVGIFKQFPTSAQDSDMVMNRALMDATRGISVNDLYLVRADGTTAGATRVAAEIKQLFPSTAPARVDDLTTTLAVDQSTLTSLNLSGLSTIEGIFTLVIAFAGFGSFLLAAIAERAREFSTMRAIGAAPSQLRRLLAIEGGSIMIFGLLLSVPVGFLIARVLITLLTPIFPLPVSGLSFAPMSLALLFGVSAAGLAAALALAAQALPRLSLGTTLREE